MMAINYWAILVCGIVSMIIGMLWYGPIFGKKWMEITGMNKLSKEEQEKMKKSANGLYAITFVLALFQAFVLAWYIASVPASSGIDHGMWVWAGFMIPVVASGAMWNGDSKSNAWARFWINAGYYLVQMVVFGLILGMWR